MYKRYLFLFTTILMISLLSIGCKSKKDDHKTKSDDKVVNHVVSSANVSNEDKDGVLFATAINFDEWIYFGNPDDRHRIYRMHVDGSGLTKIVDARMEGFHDLKEWVYYLDTTQPHTPAKLARVKWDGSEKEVLVEENVEMFQQSDDYIIYAFENNIYRINLDGSANMKVVSSDEKVCYMKVFDHVIYYSTSEGLFSITEDGVNQYLIAEGEFPRFDVKNHKIYYNDDKLYSMSLKGIEEKVVIDKRLDNTFIWQDSIYYNEGDDLYQVNIHTGDTHKIYVDSYLNHYYEKDDKIYFYGHNRIWRVHQDLSTKEIVLGTGEEYLARMFIEVDDRIITKNVDMEENVSHQMAYKLFELKDDDSSKKLSDVAIQLFESKHGKILYTDAKDKKLYELDITTNDKALVLDKMIGSFMSYKDMIYYTDIQEGFRLYAYDRGTGQHINITNIPVTNIKRTQDRLYFLDNRKRMGILDVHNSIPRYIDLFTTKYDVIGDTIYYKNEDDLGRLYRIQDDGTGKERLTDYPVVDIYAHQEDIFNYENDHYANKGQVYYVIKQGANLLYSIHNDTKISKFLDIVSMDLVDITIMDGILYMHIASEGGSYYVLEKYVDELSYKVFYDIEKQSSDHRKYFVYQVDDQVGYLYGYDEKNNEMALVIDQLIMDFQIEDDWIYYSSFDSKGNYRPSINRYHMNDHKIENAIHVLEDNVRTFDFKVQDNTIYYCYDGAHHLFKKDMETNQVITLSSDCMRLGAIVDGWIYYEDSLDNPKVLRVKLDGSSTEVLTSIKRRFIYATPQYLYYLFVTEETTQKGILIKKNLETHEQQVVMEQLQWRDLVLVNEHLYYKNNGLHAYNFNTGIKRNVYTGIVDDFTLHGQELHLSIQDGEKNKTVTIPLDQ
ncbi:DUF5050 domain-containing protein [Vallitalea pronyensis]|nr:DUF5050 domain-containing protein [Vallitalea pronyensis]